MGGYYKAVGDSHRADLYGRKHIGEFHRRISLSQITSGKELFQHFLSGHILAGSLDHVGRYLLD